MAAKALRALHGAGGANSLFHQMQFSTVSQAQTAQQSFNFNNESKSHQAEALTDVKWVFLGPPGVGKGTYATRIAKLLNVAHIATGDLVRNEMKSQSVLGQQMQSIVNRGQLLSDDIVLEVLHRRLEAGANAGERGYILDGFPRSIPQAEALLSSTPISLALKLSLREEVLVEKCIGRRVCSKCKKGYNVANIYLPARPEIGAPEIVMPPMLPTNAECLAHLEQREDDTEAVVRHRLEIYNNTASPLEHFFQAAGILEEFEITGGVSETMPRLQTQLQPYLPTGLSFSG